MILSKNFPTFWLAAIGDSFSSGQGNPAKSIPKWLDEPCYRSRNSFVFKTFEKIREKCSIFTFLSCSGASVDNGILSKNGQIEKLENLMKIRKSSPDSLILTVGGNDIGFTDILSQIQEENFSEISINMRFFYVFHQLDRIAAKLAELKIPQIILVNYYDITRNENGEVDASCGKFGKVSQLNLILAERRILRRLNELLRRKAEKYGWELVDISEIFRRRGLCSKNSLIRSRNESLALQSNDYGSFHPNIEGHRLISEKLVSHLT
ncbi:unnamed protein product [Caenorhabditis angaria]|uniref:SGNH hydrolase-type esterase domain-containing protein n=1 Tax=Caenorhabditis angaria TaxID=860376 RepID=A0A9P1N5L2_9PELO|nr:unnamed protein product [Caenorhabditis angaria]